MFVHNNYPNTPGQHEAIIPPIRPHLCCYSSPFSPLPSSAEIREDKEVQDHTPEDKVGKGPTTQVPLSAHRAILEISVWDSPLW